MTSSKAAQCETKVGMSTPKFNVQYNFISRYNSSLIWGTEPVSVYNLSQSMAEGLKIQSAGYISSWLLRKWNMTRAGQADDAETRTLLETRILHKKDLKTQRLVSP